MISDGVLTEGRPGWRENFSLGRIRGEEEFAQRIVELAREKRERGRARR